MKEHYQGLGHVAIYTADMDQSIAFYEKIGGGLKNQASIQTPDGEKKLALVDFGGVTRQANLSMVDANVGDWAVVHAGFAIQIMDEEDAQETIRLWNEVLDSDKTQFC